MSYSLIPLVRKAYLVTTIETVNETEVLIAVIDGVNYVSVRPRNPMEIGPWIASRPTAKENPYYLIVILSSISVKYNGGDCSIYE